MCNSVLWVYLTFSLGWYSICFSWCIQISITAPLKAYTNLASCCKYNSETNNFSVTLNLGLNSPRSFHHGELLVWYELLDVRPSSLPAHCHSPSVIRDKKTYGTWTRLESLGVCVAYPDSQINQMPRDGQGSSLCENTLLMSLFLSTSSSPALLLSPRFIIPPLAFFLSLPWLFCTVISNTEVRVGA